MITLYRLLLPALGLLALPYYAYRMLRRGGYRNKFFYRVGGWPLLPSKKENVTRIWIQAVSVGELSSIAKLLDFLFIQSFNRGGFNWNHQHWFKNGSQKIWQKITRLWPLPSGLAPVLATSMENY